MTVQVLLAAICAISIFSAADPIKSTQQVPLDTPDFRGQPFRPKPLRPKARYLPDTITLHHDGGNTRGNDFAAPLGNNLLVNSSDNALPCPLLFHSDGRLTAGSLCPTPENTSTLCIITMNPDTFDILDSWILPEQSERGWFGFTYVTATENKVLVPGANVAWELEHGADNKLRLIRTIDFSRMIEQENGILQTIIYDAQGNVWFTNGGSPGTQLGTGLTKTLVGYLTPGGQNYSITFDDQIVENSVAVSGDTVYMNTGPAGKADVVNSTGYLYAFRPSVNGGVDIVYKTEYNAGSGIKKNGLSRGSGSSPSLLGDQFVVITDNHDEQVNLLVYPQASTNRQTGRTSDISVSPVCSIPLWTPGESANEAAFTNHFDGTNYAIITGNGYGLPVPIPIPGTNHGLPINGEWNDFNSLGPGMARIDVVPRDDGSVTCMPRWIQQDAKLPSVNSLSTQNGLMYTWYQDLELAESGEYIYGVIATDFETGETAWKMRVGAGGSFNWLYQAPALSTNGCFYMTVVGGLVRMCDGAIFGHY